MTVAVATPRPAFVFRRNSTTSSPTAAKDSVFFASATTSSGPEVDDGQRHVLHLRLEREDGDGQRDALLGAQHARQGGEEHQRSPHEGGLLGGAEGPVAPGHHHHAYRAHVLRDLDLVRARGLRREAEGPQEADHGREAVGAPALGGDGRLVAADREHPLHRRAVGADHVVVEVPGAHREGLARVEVVPRVRRRVAREAEEPLVHHRQRVGHGPAGRLAHAHRGRRLRRQDLRDLERPAGAASAGSPP